MSEYETFIKSSELFSKENGNDDIYNFNRNCSDRLDILKHCELMWKKFKPYCPDLHFTTEITNDFRSRWWELTLGSSLLDHGFTLLKPNGEGPDIKFEKDGRTFWIEAISVTQGEGEDRVGDIVYGQVNSISQNPILLRITNGFYTKAMKFKSYIEKGIVDLNDFCIIAIDFSAAPNADIIDKENMPAINKALLGFGDLVMEIPIDMTNGRQAGEVQTKYSRQTEIKKNSGTIIPTTHFLNEDFAFISGVISNSRSFTSKPCNGRKLKFLSNPFGKNKITSDEFLFMEKFFYEENGYLKKR